MRGEIKMKKYSIRTLQLAYMAYTMKDNTNEEQCIYCWGNGCNCSSDSVESDLFINMTEELEYV
jgi:hypothetical protein